MKANVLTLGVLAALLTSSLAAPAAAQQGLRPVPPPGEDAPEREGLRELLAGPFDRAAWEERLRDSDLDRRERAFEALLRRARLEPGTRAWLEERARDSEAGELAWTARLALRELRRTPIAPSFPRMLDPLGGQRRIGKILQEMLGGQRDGLLLMPPGVLPEAGEGATSGRGVSVVQGEDGVRVRITEVREGEEVQREYEGASLEELLAQYPELEQALGHLRIDARSKGPFELRYRLDEGLELAPPFERDPLLQRLLEGRGVELGPQSMSRPAITDKLGVAVRALPAERRAELELGDRGLLVERVYPETFAQLLGVRAGAILLEIDAQVLRRVEDLERVMAARRPDDRLTLVWLDELGQEREKTWEPPTRER